MPTPRRRSTKKTATPLDARQRKLNEDSAKLKETEANLHRFIADAPRKVAKLKEERAAQIKSRSRAPSGGRRGFDTIPDKRFDASMTGALPARPRRRGTLKSERRQTQLISFGLVFVLALLVLLLWSNWHQ